MIKKSQHYPLSKRMTFVLFAIMATEVIGGEVQMKLEEPLPNSVYSGVANIRGWAVGSKGINRVELYVDGQYRTNIPVGGKRTDVGSYYPNYPNSADSGFSMAFNYSNETPGAHSIRVRVVDTEGVGREETANFQVVRFENPYVSDPSRVSLREATVTTDGKRIYISNMIVEGKPYDVDLDWRTETQGYAFTQIAQNNSLPDLIVPHFNTSSQVVAGGSIHVEAQVANVGGQPANGLVVGFFLTKDSSLSQNDLFGTCTFRDSLPAGASGTCSGDLPVPKRFSPGTYYPVAYADPNNTIAESDEDNNYAIANPVTITSGGTEL